MRLEVSHRTEFAYRQVVLISHHVLHLTPRSFRRQRRLSSEIGVLPQISDISERVDFFGNLASHLRLEEPHDRLTIRVRSTVDVEPAGALALDGSTPWEAVAARLERPTDGAALEACRFAFGSPYVSTGPAVRHLAREAFPPGRPILEAAKALTARIHREFTYTGGVTEVSTPVESVIESRSGVCQDFAHLEIACIRSLGLAARYVSGYLLTRPPEGRARLEGADASHAWISVWCPALGWVDFDPTNDLIPSDEHVTLAWGRDYGDVSPINGFIVGGGEHEVKVGVDVVPVADA